MQTASLLAEKAAGYIPDEELSTGGTQPITRDGEKMHAIVWHGNYDVRHDEVPKPTVTDPKDILLKVTATTICGSDLHMYAGEMPTMHPGDIVGHEFMGLVEEVGEDVKKLHKGQRVAVSFCIVCGECEYCKRGLWTSCETTNNSLLLEKMMGHRLCGVFGYSHLTGGYPGGQAEYVRVPFADNTCLPIPDDVPDEKALYLTDVLCTSLHATELGEVGEGKTVAIWGLGPIGLMAAWWCKHKGAARVIGIDCVPERLEMATKDPLNIEVIDFSKEDTVQAVFDKVPGGVDVAIEAAGFRYAKTWAHKIERALKLETDTSDILQECVKCVRKWGNLSIIGDYVGYCNQFPIGLIMEKSIKVQGGQTPVQRYWEGVLELIRKGDLDPTWLITTKGSLADAPQLYREFYEQKTGIVKVFLRP